MISLASYETHVIRVIILLRDINDIQSTML